MAVLDISSNRFFCSQFSNFESLCEQIYKLSPSEVVIEKKLFSDTQLKEVLQKKYNLNIYFFESLSKPEQVIFDFFGVTSLE